MDDVSIDLEEGLQSNDHGHYDEDWQRMQLEGSQLNDNSAAESPDPLQLAQEAMLQSADDADQEIEHIINKKLSASMDSHSQD